MLYGFPQFPAYVLQILNVMPIRKCLFLLDTSSILGDHFHEGSCRSDAFAAAFGTWGRFGTQERRLYYTCAF
jgi:hypothetical protein